MWVNSNHQVATVRMGQVRYLKVRVVKDKVNSWVDRVRARDNLAVASVSAWASEWAGRAKADKDNLVRVKVVKVKANSWVAKVRGRELLAVKAWAADRVRGVSSSCKK